MRIGVKDSKQFAPKGREHAALLIREVLEDAVTIVYSPAEIDQAVRGRQLNVLESRGMAEIINPVCPDVVYVDAVGRIIPGLFISGPGIRNFRHLLRDLVRVEPKLIIEHHADERYPVVAAASVLAKVTRDRLVVSLHEKYGEPFGSDYPDRKTVDFLVRYYQAHRCFPEDMRLNWKTRRKLVALFTQKKLDDFPVEFRSCDGGSERREICRRISGYSGPFTIRRNRQIIQQKARDRFFSHDGHSFRKAIASLHELEPAVR